MSRSRAGVTATTTTPATSGTGVNVHRTMNDRSVDGRARTNSDALLAEKIADFFQQSLIVGLDGLLGRDATHLVDLAQWHDEDEVDGGGSDQEDDDRVDEGGDVDERLAFQWPAAQGESPAFRVGAGE